MRNTQLLLLLLLLSTTSPALAQSTDFNQYVLAAIQELYPKYAGGGYDMSKVYTHDIDYGEPMAIPKTSPLPPAAPSMCVAAVTEVIATAINLYYESHKDARDHRGGGPIPLNDVIDRVPVRNFTHSSLVTLRGNFFMLPGTGSRGTASTLRRFGLGEELPFDVLKPGDFVNFNRSSHTGHPTGHAVVFLGYLDKAGGDVPAYGPSVAGFKYFSDQGKGKSDAGLGFRWAFFEPNCPILPAGKTRDCNIIRSSNRALLNTGRMYDPHQWTIEDALPALRAQTSRGIAGSQRITRAAADKLLDQPIDEKKLSSKLNGVDSD